MTRAWRPSLWQTLFTAIAAVALAAMSPVTFAHATAPPTTMPTTTTDAPLSTNDLIPENNDVTDCIGTVEQANCGSKARADGHTYLVFAVLAAGMAFIGWRIARGVRARDAAHQAAP